MRFRALLLVSAALPVWAGMRHLHPFGAFCRMDPAFNRPGAERIEARSLAILAGAGISGGSPMSLPMFNSLLSRCLTSVSKSMPPGSDAGQAATRRGLQTP